MKLGRQTAIYEIVTSRDIETQFDLLQALEEKGIKTTQATLSRDIRDMHLIKETTSNGRFRYAVSADADAADNTSRLERIFKDSITSINVAQNLVVIKTLPGLAPAACSAIDSMDVDGLVGTIAGDDTAFLAMKDNSHALRFFKEIESI